MRDWLKAIRLSKGLSTYQVAELAGIGQSYYWAIEAGERGNPLKVPVAQAIARALGFDWTRFYEDGGDPNERTQRPGP